MKNTEQLYDANERADEWDRMAAENRERLLARQKRAVAER